MDPQVRASTEPALASLARELRDPLAVVLGSAGAAHEIVAKLVASDPRAAGRLGDVADSLRAIEAAALSIRDVLARLEQAPGHETASAALSRRQGRDGGAPSPRRALVFVIEDDPLVSDTIRRILEREHDVIVENEPARAAELVRAAPAFDVVLCDLTMPGLDGLALFEAACAASPELARRFAFVTGSASAPRWEPFLRSVPNRRLDKPFRASELRAMVRDVLSDTRARPG
jgi:CheY-like chemotaxis protein